MPKRINVPNVAQVNFELLDQQLKAAAPADCYGISMDVNGLHIEVSDGITPELSQTLTNLVLAHTPSAETANQTVARVGKVDLDAILSKIDQAVTDINAKQATFKGSPTLGTAAPLLNEIADDMVGLLKAFKYIAKKVNGQLP